MDGNASRQMTSKPLISTNELQELPQGTFIVRRTGQHPMLSRLYLFLRLGVTFPDKFTLKDKGIRPVKYLLADELEKRVRTKYPSLKVEPTQTPAGASARRSTRQQADETAEKLISAGSEPAQQKTKKPEDNTSGVSIKKSFKSDLG